MTFSKQWEYAYSSKKHLSIWPWSDLVSLVNRYVDSKKKQIRILELGCGAGANIPFFIKKGFKYYGIDGSKTIVKNIKNKFPEIKDNIIVGDFTNEVNFKGKFDLIIDRASLTHNSTPEVKKCVEIIYNKMNYDSKYIGIDWFSTKHSDYKNYNKIVDTYTRTSFTKGDFENIGMVHFSNKKHLEEIFKKFEFITLEHKVVTKVKPELKKLAYWNFVLQKK